MSLEEPQILVERPRYLREQISSGRIAESIGFLDRAARRCSQIGDLTGETCHVLGPIALKSYSGMLELLAD
ncbi:MAG TPA: hypothetical protein VGL29_13695 [Blastocatellia bacterium]